MHMIGRIAESMRSLAALPISRMVTSARIKPTEVG